MTATTPTCPKCGAPVRCYLSVASGREIAFDMDLHELGNYGKRGPLVSEARVDAREPATKRLMAHAVTCKARSRARSRARTR